jgi:hypothetical protein
MNREVEMKNAKIKLVKYLKMSSANYHGFLKFIVIHDNLKVDNILRNKITLIIREGYSLHNSKNLKRADYSALDFSF